MYQRWHGLTVTNVGTVIRTELAEKRHHPDGPHVGQLAVKVARAEQLGCLEAW